jgi:hypothetical protein
MTKRRPSTFNGAGSSKKQRVTPPVDAHDPYSAGRESPGVDNEERQQDSDAPIEPEEVIPVVEDAETTEGKAKPIKDCFNPFAVQPTNEDLKDVKVLDFWGITPQTKDVRPNDLHAVQPSARESGGQTNPELWEDRKWRFKNTRYVKYHGNEKPDDLDEENASDIDQEENLIFPLLNMTEKSSRDLTPRRRPTRYWYPLGLPKNWADPQTLKAMNDRRVQAIERNCEDPPWSSVEREYLAKLLANKPDASIWELTQLYNDHFKGTIDTTSPNTAFGTDEEAAALFANPGRTIESVRAQYMSYKVSYDKGKAPTGVREKKDKTTRLSKARAAYIAQKFGEPNRDDDSSSSEDDDQDGDKGGEKEREKNSKKKKVLIKKNPKDKNPTGTKEAPSKDKKEPATKKPRSRAKKDETKPPSADDTYEDYLARYMKKSFKKDQIKDEVKARNLVPKPQPKTKPEWAAILARDDLAKNSKPKSAPATDAPRKNRGIKSSATKKPSQIDDSDPDSADEERAQQEAAAAMIRSQPETDPFGEEILDAAGINNPEQTRRERTPLDVGVVWGDYSDSDLTDPPSDIGSPIKGVGSGKRKSADGDSLPPKRVRGSRSSSLEDLVDGTEWWVDLDKAEIEARREVLAALKMDEAADKKKGAAAKRAAARKAATVAKEVEDAKKGVAEAVKKGETRGAVRKVLTAGGSAVKVPVVKKSEVKVVIGKKAVVQETTVEVEAGVVVAPAPAAPAPAAPAPAAPAPNAIRFIDINEDDYDDDDDDDDDQISGPDADAVDEDEDEATDVQPKEGEYELSPSDDEMYSGALSD